MLSFKNFISENIVYHYTSHKNKDNILKSGFKTGKELNAGERTGAVYATQVNTGVNYNRHGGKTIKIPIDISKIKSLDLDSLPKDPNKHSFEQQDYVTQQNAENGIFPEGYDAVHRMSSSKKGKIHQIAIKPEVASKFISKE